MKKIMLLTFSLILFPLFIFASPVETNLTSELKSGTYALFQTSLGDILCELYPKQAPVTVENFIGLATGKKEWISYQTGRMMKKTPLYSGTIFHRVIPNFMIQGGDQLGTGRGGTGYKFEDEFSDDLKHDRPGRLSMANSGPNTNSSQFFITTVATPWLDGKHTIFGQVIKGQDIVQKISLVKRDKQDKPIEPVILKEIQIIVK